MLQGFTISLKFEYEPFSGIQAVDKCRQLHMPTEQGFLYTNQEQVSFAVTNEELIRTWFPVNKACQIATVKIDWLGPNDVFQEGNRIHLLRTLPEERIWQLFIRAMVESHRNLIAQLTTLNEKRAELSVAKNDLAAALTKPAQDDEESERGEDEDIDNIC